MHIIKTKIVYIASNAHAGSSITDIMLGQSKNLVSFGQVCDVLFKDSSHENAVVSKFWEKLFTDEAYDNSKLTLQNADRLYKEKALLQSLFNTEWSKKHLEIYENLYMLMGAYAHPNGDVIVDSSKNTTHAISLSRSKVNDMYYIHLIKSPESFIDSINKRRLEFDKTPIVVVSYLRWATKAFLNNVILKNSVKNYIKIRYEDLANNSTTNAVDKLEKFIGEDLTETKNVLASKKMKKVHYALSGNRIINNQYQTFKPYANKQAKYNKMQTFLIKILVNNPITNWLYNK